MKKAVLIFGPSGSGKSYYSELLSKNLDYLHIEGDMFEQNIEGLKHHQLENEWSTYIQFGNPNPLLEELLRRADLNHKPGTILSLHSILPPQALLNITAFSKLNFAILYGNRAECIRAYLDRDTPRGLNPTEEHWDRCNRDFLEMDYQKLEPFIVQTFAGGTRRATDDVLEDLKRLATR